MWMCELLDPNLVANTNQASNKHEIRFQSDKGWTPPMLTPNISHIICHGFMLFIPSNHGSGVFKLWFRFNNIFKRSALIKSHCISSFRDVCFFVYFFQNCSFSVLLFVHSQSSCCSTKLYHLFTMRRNRWVPQETYMLE